MRYGCTRVVAGVDVAIGVILIVAGLALAIAVFVIPWQKPFWSGGTNPPSLFDKGIAAVVAVLAGIVFGGVFIVGGQLTLAFLNIEARLGRIDRRLKRWEQSFPEQKSKWTDRLRPR